MLVSWQRILIRNQLNASNASDSQNNTIVAATGVPNLRLTVSLVRFRHLIKNHLIMFGQESYLVRFMKLTFGPPLTFGLSWMTSTSSTYLWRWHLTASFTTVIINRLARGFRLTRNVNTGRNKLLLLSTYMVVFDEDGLYHDWVWKGHRRKAQLFTTHDHAIGNSFILA